MRVRYRNQDDLSDAARQVIEREAARLSTRLPHVGDDLKVLNVSVEQQLRDGSRTITLHLNMPGRDLAATGRGPRDDTALRDAFQDLDDQLARHLAKLRGEPAQRREGKFHRDTATLVADLAERAQGWPSEPPRTPEEAAAWGRAAPDPER